MTLTVRRQVRLAAARRAAVVEGAAADDRCRLKPELQRHLERAMNDQRPNLGVGVGWRPELALWIERCPEVRFVEVIAEDMFAARDLPDAIVNLLENRITIIPHGISLSLGGAEPIDRNRIESLGRLALRLNAPFVSEHIAFVRAGGTEVGHLLPPPRTRKALDVLVENVRTAQKLLPVPLALENIATLLEWPGAELDEATFLADALLRKRTRAVRRAWPGLARALGDHFDASFAVFARTTPVSPGGPLADGRAFARALSQVDGYPDQARLEILAFDLRHKATPAGLVPRRGLGFVVAFLRTPRRFVAGARVPLLGERWFSIPYGRRRPN